MILNFLALDKSLLAMCIIGGIVFVPVVWLIIARIVSSKGGKKEEHSLEEKLNSS
jgi:hypothetical protein